MTWLDHAVLGWLNGFAGHSRLFDAAVTELARSNLPKGVLLGTVLFAYWFADAPDEERQRRREIIVATFLAAAVALVLGRVIAHALPIQIQPVHDPTLGFVPPYGGAEHAVSDGSTFPSDHAMLFAAMATGILSISRRVGVLSFAYAAVFIFVPRMYLGWHHPTDILAGTVLGVLVAAVVVATGLRARAARLPLAVLARRPGVFYAAAFIVMMQVTTLFSDVRRVLHGVEKLRSRPAVTATAHPDRAFADPVGMAGSRTVGTGRSE